MTQSVSPGLLPKTRCPSFALYLPSLFNALGPTPSLPKTARATLTLGELLTIPRNPTEKQIKASRRNGAKSRGPVTAQGKQVSSLNTYKHSRYAKFPCLVDTDDEAAVKVFVLSYYRTHQPVNDVETQLVDVIAACDWHINRYVAATVSIDERPVSSATSARRSTASPICRPSAGEIRTRAFARKTSPFLHRQPPSAPKFHSKSQQREQALTPTVSGVPEDVVQWARSACGFEPDDIQRQILGSTVRHLMLCCTRQFASQSAALRAASMKP